MADPLLIAQRDAIQACILPALANRHGLITGATGTGKTVTLQKMAESFSAIGIPVFAADVKGDLSGISREGRIAGKIADVLASRDIASPEPHACPVTFWDVFGEQGHPVRATISDMGPLLLARMLDLNDTQSGILDIAFRIADEQGLLLLDLKDLRAMLQHVGDHAAEYKTEYGNISKASVGAIQRGLLQLQTQGAEQFFGEPALNLDDMMQTVGGQGVVNVLAADRLLTSPRLYTTFLLWLLSDLYERLPEIGDPEQPRFVFFFDEAHLLFKDAPKVLLERIELVVRLVRSKGVGVYFCTQTPTDIPDAVLAQLGNRVQHALRAYTPRDQKAIRATAQTMRPNPELDVEAAITELATGEALISFLDEKGRPGITQRVYVIPPGSQIGAIDAQERKQVTAGSLVAGVYDEMVDRESAYEILAARSAQADAEAAAKSSKDEGLVGMGKEILFGRTGPRGGRTDGIVMNVIKGEARRSLRAFVRGAMGTLLNGGKR